MEQTKNKIITKLYLYFIYCFLGTVATIYVVVLGYNAIIASSIIGIFAAYFAITVKDENHSSWAAFCGSFAGMISLDYISFGVSYSSYQFLLNTIFLAIIVSLLYTSIELISFKFPHLLFEGYGGKLGATAFISVVFYVLIEKYLFNHKINFLFHNLANSNNLFYGLNIFHAFAVISAVIGALISMEIKKSASSLNDNYKVLTVGITGLVGGLLLVRIPQVGYELGAAWYAGAFVGMSSYFILMFVRHYFLAGLISGGLYLLTRNVFVGIGGKLGLISFLSVLTMRIIFRLMNKFNEMFKEKPEEIVAALETGEKISNGVVDDDYAQKLVESLMKSKSKDSNKETNNKPQNENNKNENNNSKSDDLVLQVKDFLEGNSYLNWVLLERHEYKFNPVDYEGISYESIDKLFFNKNAKIISTLESNKSIITLGEKGIRQPVFLERFIDDDIINTNYLSLFPIYDSNYKLIAFFIVLNSGNSNNSLKLKKLFYEITPKIISKKQIFS